MTTDGAGSRLRSLLAEIAHDTALRVIAGRPVALGWATVELDRACRELGAELGFQAERFVHATPSSVLGARCLVVEDGLEPGVALVILEPATEGRLTASLARNDEGPVAVWLAVTGLGLAVAALRRAGVTMSAKRPGPLGPERLLLDGPIHGPQRLVVERAGTIRA